MWLSPFLYLVAQEDSEGWDRSGRGREEGSFWNNLKGALTTSSLPDRASRDREETKVFLCDFYSPESTMDPGK